MKLAIVAVAFLLFMGCAAPRGYYPQPQHYHKEFSVEMRENDLGNPKPQIVATFKIFN